MNDPSNEDVVMLEPASHGAILSGPMSSPLRRTLVSLQKDQVELETSAAMTKRAEAMFLTLPNGPHRSGMVHVRVLATNSLLELVRKTAYAVWVARDAEIKVACPKLWDEELLRGWLLADALGHTPLTELAARTIGKRAATRICVVEKKAKRAAKQARKAAGSAAVADEKEVAAADARAAVFNESYDSLFHGLELVSGSDRPPRPATPLLAAATVAAVTPATVVDMAGPREAPAPDEGLCLNFAALQQAPDEPERMVEEETVPMVEEEDEELPAWALSAWALKEDNYREEIDALRAAAAAKETVFRVTNEQNDMLMEMVSMLKDMLANEECYNEKFLTRALRDKYPSRFISAKAEAFSRWRVLFTGDMEGVLV